MNLGYFPNIFATCCFKKYANFDIIIEIQLIICFKLLICNILIKELFYNQTAEFKIIWNNQLKVYINLENN